MVPQPHTPTVRTLLAQRELNLTLISTGLGDGALDRAVRWVHSSDLADPTPFLADDLLLLTTGTQFVSGTAREADDYVTRLVSRGVVALGFGTEVVRDGVPAVLADACSRASLPLFEVPYRTPFIAVARANAEAVAAQAYARRSWALAAQRSIAIAALLPDGLGATVAELGKQLDVWVALFDAHATVTRESTTGVVSESVRAQLHAEVAATLRRAPQTASSLTIEDQPFILQTLGRARHTRGVIAIASHALDHEARDVVTAVVAMAGLAFEQQEAVRRARARLRSGIVALLRHGHTVEAFEVAHAAGETLPAEPLTVAVIAAAERAAAAIDWLELKNSTVLVGRDDDEFVVLAADDTALAALATQFDVRVGVSGGATYATISGALDQARFAREHGRAALSRFADVRSRGVLSTLPAEARVIAAELLAPLHRSDATTGSELVTTLRAFLEHNGSAEATATALGVHRHTVRARMRAAEQALNMPLDSFATRAELWAALLTTGA